MPDDRAAVRRWKAAHSAVARRQLTERAAEGAAPEQAIREALSALNALAAMGLWPGPRDPVSERAVITVRRRWARIQKRARQLARSR